MKPIIKWSGSRIDFSTAALFLPAQIDTYYEPFLTDGLFLCDLLSSKIEVKKCVVVTPCKDLFWFWDTLQKKPEFFSLYYKHRLKETQIYGATIFDFILDNYSGWPEQVLYLGRMANISYERNDFTVSGFEMDTGEQIDELLASWSARIKNVEFRYGDFAQIQPEKNDFVLIKPPSDINYDKLYAWLETLSCKYRLEQ